MTLEFEKLSTALEQMGQHAKKQQRQHEGYVEAAQRKLKNFAEAWDIIANCLQIMDKHAPTTRLASPFDTNVPIDQGIDVPSCPQIATIFATDGSQIYPDRHAAFLYYLINVGGIIYHHGSGQPPTQENHPTLKFKEKHLFMNDFIVSGAVVSARRDLEEIRILADMVFRNRHEVTPLLAILDQRLLYWPFWPATTDAEERTQIVKGWQLAMEQIRHSGSLLAGYIDQSRRSSVIHLLQLLNQQAMDYETLLREQDGWQGVTDSHVFARLLAPGQRSVVFMDVSQDNKNYASSYPATEVCFFYLNVASEGHHIARVDIPYWVAENPDSVDIVHALLIDQCKILGDYPYVLTRADELAVVGRQDQAELNHWIELKMQHQGIQQAGTAKQSSKDIARAGKTRHEL